MTAARQIVHACRKGLGSIPTNRRRPDVAQKQQRGNREAKKPKQDKTKKIVSSSPFASSNSNPGAKAAANTRK